MSNKSIITNKSKRLIAKILAVVVVLCLFSGVAPFNEVGNYFGGILAAKAESAPDYTENPAPVEILSNPGFEGANPTTNWTAGSSASVAVSTQQYKSGSKSLELTCRSKYVYYAISGLSTQTDYLFHYNAFLPGKTAGGSNVTATVGVYYSTSDIYTTSNKLNTNKVFVKGGIYATSTLTNSTTTAAWNQDTIYFNSGQSTTVYVAFNYVNGATSSKLYLDDLSLTKMADYMPVIENGDSSCITLSYNTSTKKLDANSSAPGYLGFEGWYYQGLECNVKSATLSATYPFTTYKYTAKFINFSAFENGGFEGYSNGYNLKTASGDNKWYSNQNLVVTNEMAFQGEKSAKMYATAPVSNSYYSMYRHITGLQQNKQYTVSFNYHISDPQSYLYAASVISGDSTVDDYFCTGSVATLANKPFDGTSGVTAADEWKQVTLTFFTGNYTDVIVAMRCTDKNQSGIAMYVDNLAVYNDDYAAPDYLNQDFDRFVPAQYKTSKDLTIERVSKDSKNSLALTATNGGQYFFTSGIQLKKGYTYTLSVKFNLGTYLNDSNNPTFHFGFYNESTRDLESNLLYNASNNSSNNVQKYYYDNNGSKRNTLNEKDTHVHCTRNTSALSSGYPTVQIKFKAKETTVVYAGFSMQVAGTVYIDQISVTEDASTATTAEKTNLNAFETVGSAIRMTGTQGLRLKTAINRQFLCNNTANNTVRAVEYGTLAIRTDFINGNELVYDGSYQYKSKTKTPHIAMAYSVETGKNVVFDETADKKIFTCVLTGIPDNYFNAGYTMRPYFKYYDANNVLQIAYGPVTETSVYNTAELAYTARKADGSFAENEGVRQYLYDDIIMKYTDHNVTINNNLMPISTNFGGVSSTVYHCYTYMIDDSEFAIKNDERATIEMDRLASSGITTVRTVYSSAFSWNYNTNRYNWKTDQMIAFYKWAKELQKRGIDICLNGPWSLPYFVSDVNPAQNQWYPESTYLYGNGDSYYGETDGYTFKGTTAYERRLETAALRYGEFIRQSLEAFKANGVFNVKYVMPFTEPSYATTKQEGDYAAEYVTMVRGLDIILRKANMRGEVSVIGPNQGIDNGNGLLKYYLEYIKNNPADSGMIDILSSHSYAESDTLSINDPTHYYNRTNSMCQSYRSTLNDYNNKSEFWLDEFNVRSTVDAIFRDGTTTMGTQFAAGVVAAMKNGVNRICSWQLFDQKWLTREETAGEFVSGIHMCGTCPFFNEYGDYVSYASLVPRNNYYAFNLLGKQLGSCLGSVYSTTETAKDGLYISAVGRADGKTVILAVNTNGRPMNVTYTLGEAIRSEIEKYNYAAGSFKPTADATPIQSTICKEKANHKTFTDVLEKQSFAIYVLGTLKNEVEFNVGQLG